MSATNKIKISNENDEYADAERISTREFLRNYNKYRNIAKRTGKVFIATNQNVDELVIKAVQNSNQKKKYTMKDILNLRFSSGEKNMSDSREIDKVVYGI